MAEWITEGTFDDFGSARKNYPTVSFKVVWGELSINMSTPRDPEVTWSRLAEQAALELGLGYWDFGALSPAHNPAATPEQTEQLKEMQKLWDQGEGENAATIVEGMHFDLYLEDDDEIDYNDPLGLGQEDEEGL